MRAEDALEGLAGTTTEFHYGPDLFCNQARFPFTYHTNPPALCGNPDGTGPVGSYAPNAFGLYDMHGNVWEWCLDSFAPYTSAPLSDPFVTFGSQRILRGGGSSSSSASGYCRSAFRNYRPSFWALADLGFRVALAPILVP